MRVVVEAHDYDEALAFYRDVLGSDQELQIHSSGGEHVTILDVGRATLELSNPAQVDMIDRVEVGHRVSPHLRVAFEVADAATVTEELVRAGAALVAAPTITPWGSLNARLNAPGELQISVFQELEGTPAPPPYRAAAPRLPEDTALIVVDAQAGFDDPEWGRRNNHDCDVNIATLVDTFVSAGLPVVYVRHESADPTSTLHPRHPGNALKPYLQEHTPSLVVTKTVHSSFHGSPDLDTWLRGRGVAAIVIAGITTNHCCETTARVGEDLGYDVWFALDATHTFDRVGPDGAMTSADELSRATATNLHDEFATIVTTAQVVEAVGELKKSSSR